MSESQLNEIKANWQIASDRTHPENAAAVSKLIFTDMPALLSYAQVEVRNQTELKLEVLRRIMELSVVYRKIDEDDAPIRTDPAIHSTELGC